jgi:hypothetical protein
MNWRVILAFLAAMAFLYFSVNAAFLWVSVVPPAGVDPQAVPFWRMFSTVGAVISLTVALLFIVRWDREPDFLRGAFGSSYYEQGGFGFRPGFEFNPTAGVFEYVVYCQNRFSGPVKAVVVLDDELNEQLRFFPKRLHVDCPGGAFAVAHVPLSIPADASGRLTQADVFCDVDYPNGRGRELRFRQGGAVQLPLGKVQRTAIQLVEFAVLQMITTPARVSFEWPDLLPSCEGSPGEPRFELLWSLGDERPEDLPRFLQDSVPTLLQP